MIGRIAHHKDDLHQRIKALDLMRIEICLRIESQPIGSGFEGYVCRKKLLHAAIGVSVLGGERGPVAAGVLLDRNGNAGGGAAA